MSEGISYQAKDILFKSLSEFYKDQALDVYGLHGLPRVKALLPSEYPAVTADEKRSDTLFLLEDNSLLMLEYESNSRLVENHLKYLQYAHRILHRYYQESREMKKIHIAVIYTSNVSNVKEEYLLNAGNIKISSSSILLCEYNGDAILYELEEKISQNEVLTNDEMMKLILVPLMHSKEERQTIIEKTIDLAKTIRDEVKQVHIIAGILTATDKFINDEYAKKVKEWIKMTKVARLFELEKEEAVKEAVKDAVAKKDKEKALEIAKNFLDVLPIEEIAKRTGLTIEEVAGLAKR